MMKRSKALLAGLIICGLGTHSVAAPILDQAQENFINVSLNPTPLYKWQQEVVVGTSGLLAGIELYTSFASVGTVTIFSGPAFATGTRLTSVTANISNANDWNYIDVSTAGIILQAGDEFVIQTQEIAIRGDNTNPYAAGEVWRTFNEGPAFLAGHIDIAFRTFMDASSTVPAPASLVILLVGLAGFRLRALKAVH